MALKQILKVFDPDVARSDEQEFGWPLRKNVGVIEIGVLGNDHPALLRGNVIDDPVCRPVAGWKFRSVNGIMPRGIQQLAERRRQLRIHQKPHATTRCWLLSFSDCAANSRHASRSSRWRSGNSASTSSMVSP